MALGAVAAAQHCFELTLRVRRRARGVRPPIGRFQAIRHKFAEMATKIEAGRALTYHALRLFVEGQDALREVTQAKLLTQRAAFDVADTACRSTAAPATWASTGSSAPRATRAWARSAAAPTRS